MHGLARPNPHTRSDPHDHVHQVLDHEYGKQRPWGIFEDVGRARHRIAMLPTHVIAPRDHPIVEIKLFVNQTRDYDHRRYGI